MKSKPTLTFITLLTLVWMSSCASNPQTQTFSSRYKQKDSIIVQSTVKFETDSANVYRYSENDPYLYNIIRFELKVINHTQKNIPDLNFHNRDKYVTFFINDAKENKLVYTIDESTSPDPKDWVIRPGESDHFSQGWYFDLDEKYGLIHFYGTEFTVQWEYMGIRSEKYRVDMKKKGAILFQ